jgi:carbon monoxide dehydrogenase subunit G
MKKVELRGRWLIKAPKSKIYDVIVDFERSVELFPDVAKSIEVLERNGTHLRIEAKTKASKLSKTSTVKMDTQLNPPNGFHSTNTSSLCIEDETVTLEETDDGTVFDYKNDVTITTNRFIRPLVNLLISKIALKFWEKKYIVPLKRMLE